MNRLALYLYRIFVIPPVVVALPFLALVVPKIREGLRLRRGRLDPLTDRPIWIHAASGEFEYAKSVIRELKVHWPDVPVVVTFFSPTFAGQVARFPGVDRAIGLPLDLPGPTLSFLRKMKPRLLLVARTDLWPEMLEQCRLSQIPVVLFSYTQKQLNSLMKRSFTRWILQSVREVYCVSEADKENLTALHLPIPCAVMGDTRYDQVRFRLDNPKPLPVELKPTGNTPVLVAGSSWPEDEAVLLEGLAPLLREGRLKLILVPHEPTAEHIADLKKRLAKVDLKCSLFSEAQPWSQVLLVDKIGVLAELYAWADFAFVGGSFRKSVHSVMEALGAGCATFVGPYHQNNREAMEFKTLSFSGQPGLEVARDASDLRTKLSERLSRPHERFRAELLAEFRRRLGASQRLVDALQKTLN